VLTVNDPTGLGSVPAEDQEAASGVIDTSEQLGGAVGILVFTVVLLHIYFGRIFELLAGHGITPTQSEMHRGREFILRAEQKGLRQVSLPPSSVTSSDSSKTPTSTPPSNVRHHGRGVRRRRRLLVVGPAERPPGPRSWHLQQALAVVLGHSR
jgi:hypothetical protein